MARSRTVHRCSSCGGESPKWSGRCPGCGDWNTLSEELQERGAAPLPLAPSVPPTPITELVASDGRPVPAGIEEFDRVVGGGLVPGSVTLLGGEPGVGKSTLVLQLLATRARTGATVLYITGEESTDQVRLRAERLGALDPRLLLAAETSLPAVVGHLRDVRPDLCVVDSVQTLHDPTYSSAPGSVTQVRECAHQLVQVAKSTGTTVVLVGHVTKDGQLSGPRVLEHVVDTVLSLEGDRHHAVRILRAQKHRFGSTEELGLFSHTGGGLEAVPDPSAMFLVDRAVSGFGSVVVPTLEGQRPLLVEVQALVATSALPQPRRSVQGLEAGRVALLLAVLEKGLGLPLGKEDVYAMTAGGVRLTEPGADLAVCAAVASSFTGRPIRIDTAVCGEVGLGGELRQVGRLDRRLGEAARLGFRRAVVPASAPEVDAPIEMVRAEDLLGALMALDLVRVGTTGPG
jgi:DNA repair protein RadA/Sms